MNDFDTAEGLRDALRSQDCRAAFSDTARNFPRSLVGSSAMPASDDDVSSIGSGTDPGELDWVLTNYNAEISQTQSLSEELKRLLVLKSYLILDSERESSFERLTALASRMFRVPIALVSLVDLGRQWFMSNRGLGDARETPRKFAFCAHVIISKEDLMIVPNATLDPRFAENPLVTGPPHIRFYAGAPLICPEGYKLGNFCIIDSEPRPAGLTLEEKQNLRELAELAVDAMVERKRQKLRVLEDKSQIIACTAHDLLTPLFGVQMSLSLLLEDEELQRKLSAPQKELIVTAGSCTNVMNRICQHAIDSFRSHEPLVEKQQKGHIVVEDLVKNLHMVMEPYPKSVPLYITVDPKVPPVFISDDLKVFRSAVNLLTNACKKTVKGSVQLRIYVAEGKRKKLVVECEDTGSGVPLEHYQYLFRPFREEDNGASGCCVTSCMSMDNSGLGLYSVASQISSIGGEYGFRPRPEGGAIFWFLVPLRVPEQESTKPECRKPLNGIPEVMQAHTVQLTQQAETLAKRIQDLSTELSTSEDRKMLAIDESSSEFMASVAVAASGPNTPPNGRRIRRALVIDDSNVIRKSLNRAMSKLGFDVQASINGLDGLKELQSDVFDIVLCDFLMPVMDGLDCIKQYREWESIHRPWIRQYIVGMSAHASANDLEKGLAAGMDNFKAKPVTLKALKELEASSELKRVSDTLDTLKGMEKRAIDLEDKNLPVQKRIKVDDDDTEPSNPVCLIGEDASNVSKTMAKIIESKLWNTVVVNDGEDVLRLLKMRNWDAVFLSEEMHRLDGIRVNERFRAWENEHRVARQRNVFLISASLVPTPDPGGSVSAAYPAGFDGVLGKPVLAVDLVKLLDSATLRRSTSSNSMDIVAR